MSGIVGFFQPGMAIRTTSYSFGNEPLFNMWFNSVSRYCRPLVDRLVKRIFGISSGPGLVFLHLERIISNSSPLNGRCTVFISSLFIFGFFCDG